MVCECKIQPGNRACLICKIRVHQQTKPEVMNYPLTLTTAQITPLVLASLIPVRKQTKHYRETNSQLSQIMTSVVYTLQ